MSVTIKNEETGDTEEVYFGKENSGLEYENDHGDRLQDPLMKKEPEDSEDSERLQTSNDAGAAEDVRVKVEQNGLESVKEDPPSYNGSGVLIKYYMDDRAEEDLQNQEDPLAEPSKQPSTSGFPVSDTRNDSRFEDEDDPIECKFCKYRLQSSEKRYPRVVFCGECGWNSVESWKLRRHVQNRHPVERPFFYCQHCEYRVEQVSSWLGDDRPYECGECDYRARTSTALNYHLRAKHSDERPYKCPHCSYAGVQSSSLKSHMLTRHNTGEKNILCPQCDFRANIPSVMKKHLERKHGDSRSRRAKRQQMLGDLIPRVQYSVQESLLDASEEGRDASESAYRPSEEPEAAYRPSEAPQEQHDVADYLQMPSFGLFEAIYESQGLALGHQYAGKLRNPEQHSDVIVIDD